MLELGQLEMVLPQGIVVKAYLLRLSLQLS